MAFGWTGGGPWGVALAATYLDNYTELTSNPDGSVSVFDRTGTLTDETFQRGFAEWRVNGRVDWRRERWSTGVTLRWTDDMLLDSGSTLDSVLYTDLLVSYDLPFGAATSRCASSRACARARPRTPRSPSDSRSAPSNGTPRT